jgi:hypothetical protein
VSALFHVALGPSLHRHNCVCFSTRAPVLPWSVVPSFPLIHLRAPPSPSYSYSHLPRFNLTLHAQWSPSNAILATHTTIAPATISLTFISVETRRRQSLGRPRGFTLFHTYTTRLATLFPSPSLPLRSVTPPRRIRDSVVISTISHRITPSLAHLSAAHSDAFDRDIPSSTGALTQRP